MQKILFVADGTENARKAFTVGQLRNVSEDFARGFTDLEKSGFYNIFCEAQYKMSNRETIPQYKDNSKKKARNFFDSRATLMKAPAFDRAGSIT